MIRGLLLVIYAASAAAAAASTTTALAFLRLVTFRTGMIITGYCVCTSYMGSYTAMRRLYCCTSQCSKSVCPGMC